MIISKLLYQKVRLFRKFLHSTYIIFLFFAVKIILFSFALECTKTHWPPKVIILNPEKERLLLYLDVEGEEPETKKISPEM